MHSVATCALAVILVVTTLGERAQADTPLIYVRDIGSAGSAADQFQQVTGIALDAADNVYVADGLGNKVLKYSNTGTFLGSFGSSGSSDGAFAVPVDVVVNAAGDIFVSDANNMRIEVFSSTFQYLRKWAVPESPQYLAFGFDGTSIYTNPKPYIFHYTVDGSFLGVFQYAVGGGGRAYSIGVSVGDTVVVTDGDDVLMYGPKGDLVRQWGGLGSGNGMFHQAGAVAVGPGQRIHVADGAGRIQTFQPNGEFLMAWGSGQLIGVSHDIAADAVGNVFVANGNRVLMFGRDTTPNKRESLGSLKRRYRTVH
jgi:DNA-binding beta-propeller fold protein YncE